MFRVLFLGMGIGLVVFSLLGTACRGRRTSPRSTIQHNKAMRWPRLLAGKI